MIPSGAPLGLSSIVLIVSNAIPLLGVAFWGWNMFSVIALYWMENVIIGAINILKMITSNPDPDAMEAGESEEADAFRQAFKTACDSSPHAGALHHGSKLFFIPFFTFHYGMFCAVHGVFVFTLFGGNKHMPSGSLFGGLGEMTGQLIGGGLGFAVAALAGSHLVSFATNYIGKDEYRRLSVPQLMAQPYGRIIVLHIAIIGGAFAILVLKLPAAALAILIVGKTFVDLKFHLRQRRKSGDFVSPEAVIKN